MAQAHVPDELRTRIVALLSTTYWAGRSTRAIALKLNCPWDAVALVRRQMRAVPDQIVRRDKHGNVRRMNVGKIGRCRGQRPQLRPLTARQQELAAQAAPLAEKAARSKCNGILGHDDLLQIAHIAIMRASKYWRKSLGPWDHYARATIHQQFKRAFKEARRKHDREQRLGDQEPPVLPEFQSLAEALEGLTGLPRLINEWRAGLDGAGARSPAEIADFLGVEADVADELIAEAAEALTG